MQIENYPLWICRECAKENGGKAGSGVSSWCENICDCCNEWQLVTNPRNFGYPKVTKKRDLDKIYDELVNRMNKYVADKDYHSAMEVSYMANFILDEIEYKAGHGAATIAICRGKRRQTTEGNRKAKGASRQIA
ncbi:hypothetical protein UFOVP80_8 [uncultured Caudovirales phage]|jgi:hypothetical protein|uniref:Uncharacterized protein n=1 Tax=uncultured Caudovirales phage TaxID=2100421 RepID=A0A6J5L3A2_9CAUD|nr:hypothetical protein UFOVP80_8 [uncultured Caudovirales phage]